MAYAVVKCNSWGGYDPSPEVVFVGSEDACREELYDLDRVREDAGKWSGGVHYYYEIRQGHFSLE